MPRPRARFDRFEVLLIAALALVAGAGIAREVIVPDPQEMLREQYGRPKWSNDHEELIVRDFFQDRRDGVFVDVGSADARIGSNTYVLESDFGWSGIAVDALPEYAPGYREYRPRTRFFALFVGEKSDETAKIYVATSMTERSSADRTVAEALDGKTTERTVPTITLDDLLSRAGVERIDFLSIDVEQHEPQVLAGFSLDRYRPGLICVEAHNDYFRQWHMDYFARRGYALQVKYLWMDHMNLWFAPAKP